MTNLVPGAWYCLDACATGFDGFITVLDAGGNVLDVANPGPYCSIVVFQAPAEGWVLVLLNAADDTDCTVSYGQGCGSTQPDDDFSGDDFPTPPTDDIEFGPLGVQQSKPTGRDRRQSSGQASSLAVPAPPPRLHARRHSM